MPRFKPKNIANRRRPTQSARTLPARSPARRPPGSSRKAAPARKMPKRY